jgi:eukaryotic-like serine/threonine-protein kinase
LAESPRRIAPPPRSTSADLTLGGSRKRLPEDLLREASRRLGIMSLLAAVLWLLGSALYHLVDRVVDQADPGWWAPQPSDAITLASVAVSLALFFYTRRSTRDPQFILNLGLVYMVAMCLAVGLIWHWDPVGHNKSTMPVLTWVGVILLMFAAVLPSTPTKMLIAGLIGASANPVGMLVARARGLWDFGPATNVLVMHYPDYLLVGVSVVISHVVTRLGQQVAKAREMGSYQIGDLIGRGGMGEVYKATHRMLARPAAIKLIRPEMIGGTGKKARMAAKRFHREAEAAATLRSPHTVELYDFGVTDDGTLYFAMELLEGMDLESLIRQKGPLPAARAIYLLRQVCESLEEAHARGLVHRDIKPANIYVGRVGLRDDFVKVLDFGLVTSIARATDVTEEQSLATAIGIVHGTPAYMAPEMATGDKVDGRADIYALGCVAYYMLTGHLVFEGGTMVQMVARRLNEAPVPPSERTELGVPAALDAVVIACLARRPDDRPQTAGDLDRELAAIPVAPWTEEQARAWWNLNRPGELTPIATSEMQTQEAGEAVTRPSHVHVVGGD